MEQRVTKFIDLFNYVSPEGEVNNEPSMTIPDQTMSMREILQRFARGLPVDVKVPIYDGEDDYFPDLSKMDLVDRENWINNAKEEIDRIKRENTFIEAEEVVTQKEKED